MVCLYLEISTKASTVKTFSNHNSINSRTARPKQPDMSEERHKYACAHVIRYRDVSSLASIQSDQIFLVNPLFNYYKCKGHKLY